MARINKFEEIGAFQTARTLTRRIYEVSRSGEFCKDFGLRDQMRRAAVSILSNIAEGFESRTTGLFIEFLGRAKGSAGEFRAQCYVALDAGYISQDSLMSLPTWLTKQAGRSAISCRISRSVSKLHAGHFEIALRKGKGADVPT